MNLPFWRMVSDPLSGEKRLKFYAARLTRSKAGKRPLTSEERNLYLARPGLRVIAQSQDRVARCGYWEKTESSLIKFTDYLQYSSMKQKTHTFK